MAVIVTLQNAAVATGVGTLMDVSDRPVVAVDVTIASSATITFEAMVPGGTMRAVAATNLISGAVATTATATGTYLLNVGGLTLFQARISTWVSGAVTAIGAASHEAGGAVAGATLGTVTIAGAVTATGTVAIDQTTPNTTNRVTAALYGKVTNPGDTALLASAAGRTQIGAGVASSAGAAVTGGTVIPYDSADVSRPLAVAGFGYNGSTNDPLRTPNIFKTATATASGNTALWTPASGKKFRLQRLSLQVTADVASSGGAEIDVTLQDASTGLGAGFSFYAPSVSVVTVEGGDNSGWIDIGNGILSALANNVLNINLSATLSSGKVRVMCCGTEE